MIALALAAHLAMTPASNSVLHAMIEQAADFLLAGPDPVEVDLEQRIAAARKAAKNKDPLGWSRAVMPSKFRLPFCEKLHGYFVEIRKEPFTDTEAPRDHAKTTIKCNAIPLYQALEEPEEFDYYLNIQSNEKKAFAVNTAIKLELEQNPVIRAIYGDVVGTDKWTDGLFVLKARKGIEVVFHALGAGQSIRGTNYRNRRPNYVIVDDLYDEEDINNPESTAKKNEWFWGTLYSAMAEDRPSSMHVQGTAINKFDLLWELKDKPGVKYRRFKSIISDHMKLVLWPELKSYAKRIAQRALMPAIIFAREFQNDRADDKNAIVKAGWLSGWEYEPSHLRFDAHFWIVSNEIIIDPSIGAKDTNDPAAFIRMLTTQRDDGSLPEFWIEQAHAELLSLQERVDLAKEWERVAREIDRRPVTQVVVETISGFKDFGTLVSKNVPVGTKMVDKVPDKITHLQKKSHYFQNRRIHLNKNIPEDVKKLIVQQLTTNFPDHDDLRDGILHGLPDESGSWHEAYS